MKLIGITGEARSGKDTIAKHLWAEYGFTRIAFADPLKLAAQQMFGLSHAQTWDDSLKEVVIPHWGMTPRKIFQLMGTEASKPVFGEDVWVKRWLMSYNVLKDTDDIVIPDLRFDIEADALRKLGGVIVEVRRDAAGLTGEAAKHKSEAGISTPPDFVISNNGTFDELYAAVDLMLERIA